MAKFNVGGDVKTGNGGIFLTPDKEKATTVWLAIDSKDKIRWSASQASCFTKQGKPCNASWISVGNDDPAHELGLKTDGYVAWIPVVVKDSDGSWKIQIWQTNRTNHAAVAEFEKEWELFGLRMKILMVNGRWTVQALPPHKDGPSKTQVEALLADIPNDEEFGKLVGPDDAEGVWQMLAKRLNVPGREQVRAAFGVAKKAAAADDDIEVEDV